MIRKVYKCIYKEKMHTKKKVNRNTVVLDENICLLLSDACTRILTLKENEKLRMEKLSNYPLTEYIAPDQINQLIDLNQFLALDIVPSLLRSEQSKL